MAFSARIRIMKLFTQMPPAGQHNIIMAEAAGMSPLPAFTALQACCHRRVFD